MFVNAPRAIALTLCALGFLGIAGSSVLGQNPAPPPPVASAEPGVSDAPGGIPSPTDSNVSGTAPPGQPLPADASSALAATTAAVGTAPGSAAGCELNKAFFALGLPNQILATPNGLSVIVPPIPRRPVAGQKPKPTPPRPFNVLFYNNNFRYLDNPNNTYTDPFDFLKRIPLGSESRIKTDVGGEFRWQFKNEDNRRLDGKQNDYNLFRERLYLDSSFEDRARVYIETIWADSSRQTQHPLPIDINHGDLLNAFGELRLLKDDDRTISARFGRQELLFGNQRLVSPLDWANTRRTFDDVGRLVYRGKNWDADVFWGRPIVPIPKKLDHGAQARQFYGAYAVYKEIENQTLDLYFLGSSNSDRLFKGVSKYRGNQDVYTLGTRYQGNYKHWLWETEGGFQFGNQSNRPISAGFYTGGVGYNFEDFWAKPQLWFYYDYASGNQNPNGRSFGTFNQLYPLGHKYFGYMDIVGRQNIQDPNVVLTFAPTKRFNFLVWYHHFQLNSSRDALYNAAGVATRRDASGRAGSDVGDEIDFLANFIMSPHSDWQLGVSHFFAGTFIKDTGVGSDSSFVYTQFSYRF